MSVPITATNFRVVYSSPPSVLRELLPQVFTKLRASNVGRRFAENYVGYLADAWGHKNEQYPFDTSTAGWSALERACVTAGAIEALISMLRLDRGDLHIPSYHAMYALAHLAKNGNEQQRRKMLDEVMQEGLYDVCLDRALHNELAIHRFAAMNMFRGLCSELNIGATLSAQVTADVLCQLCDIALAGPEKISSELLDPATTWQSQLMLGKVGVSPAVASKYGVRWYGLVQENCFFAMHAILCRHPAPTPQFCLEILKSRPDTIDKILDCVAAPKHPSYPENVYDAPASECILILLRFPLYHTPGVDIPWEGPTRAQRLADYDASLASLRILVSRPNWLSRILAVWKRFEVESYEVIARMLQRTNIEWYAPLPTDDDEMHSLWESRAHIRICMLRLIIGVTYVPDVKDTDLLSLLRIAYLASAKTPPFASEADDLRKWSEYEERTGDIHRVPTWIVDVAPDSIDATSQVTGEPITGPTALLRLLIALTERGILQRAQAWTSLPKGTAPSTSLSQVKQILSPAVVEKILPLALKRVITQRERINMGMGSSTSMGNMFHARATYRSIAELAACLIELNKISGGKWTTKVQGAAKELVLSLGNVAEMSNRTKDFATALGYGQAAVKYGREAAPTERITQDIIDKNKRRVAVARENLSPRRR